MGDAVSSSQPLVCIYGLEASIQFETIFLDTTYVVRPFLHGGRESVTLQKHMFERKKKNFKKAQKVRGRPDEGTPSPSSTYFWRQTAVPETPLQFNIIR